MTEPEQLNYRDGREDLPERRQTVAQFILGVVCGIVAVIPGGCSLSLANIHYNPRANRASFQTNVFDWQGPATIIAVLLLIACSVALIAHRKGKKGFAAGILAGIGMMALVEGLCFYSSWG